MFTKLLKHYIRNTYRTPLEDFTTELLVGILNNDKKLKLAFCKKFLKLKSDRFEIKSQQKHPLKNYPDCIIDIEIKGEKEICFIENKVNSKEGDNQLKRYSMVLDVFAEKGYNTKLVYCTKITEPKEVKTNNFLLCKWRNISEFFKKNSNEKITSLFIDYLKENNMSNDMTINATDIVAMESLSKIISLMEENINNVKHIFSKKFGNVEGNRIGKIKSSKIKSERYCNYIQPVTVGESYSEILYGFEFKGKIVAQIYMVIDNNNCENFIEKSKNQNIFTLSEYEHGARLYLEKNIGDYLNDDDSERKIKDWFVDSFNKISEFIEATRNEIEWTV